jgi:hypothetical protein
MPDYYFDHVHLNSDDPVKTAEFYIKMFGAEWISKNNTGTGRISVVLSLNGTTVRISTPRDGSSINGLDHFGIRTDNLSEAISELKAQGVTFSEDMREVQPGFAVSFLSAPEDVKIELQGDIS